MRFKVEELQERIAPLFQENFQRFGELGAALSIWQNGEPLLDLHGGFRDSKREQAWTEHTIVLVWSATKGIGSACLLHALQENKIKIDRRVSEFWPEFGQAGKIDVTIAQLVSHSAGLCALDENVELTDYEAVIRALEKQMPLWRPGSAHGYHARTFGFLIDELVRRVAETSISKYWRTIFAGPLTLDFWIGLPDELNSRCAAIYPGKAGIPPEPVKFYSGNRGEIDGRKFFTSDTLKLMTTKISDGLDRVFEIPTAFSAGLMKDAAKAERRLFGPSTNAFGHPGAGGSHAFADPENKIGFAYLINQMEQSVLPNEKSLRLVNAMYAEGHAEACPSIIHPSS